MTYRLTRTAAEDVRRVYRESKRLFGAKQAGIYHQYLQSIFEMLSENPEAARERAEISPPVRVHPCGMHLVVYEKNR